MSGSRADGAALTRPIAATIARVAAAVTAACMAVGDAVSVRAQDSQRADPPAHMAPSSVAQTDAPFGPSVWQGASADEISALVDALPVGAPSPAMHSLMRRLLTAPAGPPGNTLDIEDARARALARLGMVDVLAAEATRDDTFLSDPDTAAALADALLLADRMGEACALGRELVDLFDTAYWSQLVALCQIRDGYHAPARLVLARLSEARAGDPVFLALADALMDGGTMTPPDGHWRRMANPSALILTALRMAEAPIVPAALAARDPGRLIAISASSPSATEVRIDAAEAAAATGALSVAALSQLYATLPLPVDPISERPRNTGIDLGSRGRPILVQAAMNETDPTQSALLRHHAVVLASAEGAPLAVVLALLDPVEPAPSAAVLAVEAARSHYAAGEIDRARRWHDIARDHATDSVDRAALARLWPLAMLSGETVPESARAWLSAELSASNDAGRRTASVVLATLEGTGVTTDPGLWRRLAIDGTREAASLPAASVWWRLPQTARENQVGMTVLLSLNALGNGGPAAAHPVLLERVLSSLVAVGLEADAQRLGREAIWAAQF